MFSVDYVFHNVNEASDDMLQLPDIIISKRKMWHIYKMEYYSVIKRNEMEVFVVRWMELESVIQSEVSQKEKNKYSMLTHTYGI